LAHTRPPHLKNRIYQKFKYFENQNIIEACASNQVVILTKAGYKIVLTADRTLFTDYGGFEGGGFLTCLPRLLVPDFSFTATFIS